MNRTALGLSSSLPDQLLQRGIRRLPIHPVISTEARPRYQIPLQIRITSLRPVLARKSQQFIKLLFIAIICAPRIVHSTLAATLNAYPQTIQGQRTTSLEQPVT